MGGSKAAVTASNILGISAYYHDSAAALLKDGELAAAAHRNDSPAKNTMPGFPEMQSATASKRKTCA